MMTKTKLALLATVASCVLMQPAMALDAKAFVDKVAHVYKTVGYDLEFGAATLDGDTITVDGVKVKLAMDPAAPTEFDFKEPITFSGVTELEDGGYTVDSASVPDVDAPIKEDGVEGRLTVSGIKAEDLYFPGGETIPAVDLLQLVGSFSTGALSLERKGAVIVSYDSLESISAFTPVDGGSDLSEIESSFSVNNIAIDLTTVKDEQPEETAMIDALGLTKVTGNINQHYTWTLADGHINLDQLLLDFDDVGALDLTAEVTGVTPAVLDQLYAMQAKMVEDGAATTDEQSQAQMMAGMALMQGVSIAKVGVRFDDYGITGRTLEALAAQNGVEAAQFVEGLKSTLPALVGQVGIPALTDMVVPAVSAFLDDPQSLEARVQPSQPTSLLVLMAGAANPAGLIKTLGLTITANQAAAE